MGDQIINTRITADIAQAEQGIRTIKRGLKSLGDEARDLFSPLNLVKTTLASLGAWSGIQGIQSIIDTALAMERLNTQFKVITGSAILGAAEMRFVTAESKRLGQEIVVLASAYSRLIQATKGTKFEGAPTKAMFSGFSEAFTALKMTSDQMSGVWLQINQGMMKGKIQLEDINIISERGLNIIKMLEISTGKSSKELMAMIGKSELLADEYMKLGPMLTQIYGTDAKTAAQELQGTINNFSSEFFKLKASIAENFTPSFTSALKLITANMKDIVSTATTLGTVMAAVFSGRLLNNFAKTVAKDGGVLSTSVSAYITPKLGGTAGQNITDSAIAENAIVTAKRQQDSAAAALSSAKALQAYEAASVSLAQAESRRLAIMESSGLVSAKDKEFKKLQTAATAELTAAERAYASAKAATIAAQEASNVADNASVAAKARLLVATEAATISGRAMAAATWAVEGATKAASFAFNAIGGWIGVVVIALTSAVMWWNSYKKAKEDALKAKPEATTELDVIEEQIKMVKKEIAIAKGDKKSLGLIETKEAESTYQKQINRYGEMMKAFGAENRKLIPNKEAAQQWLDNANAALDAANKIKPAIETLKVLQAERLSLIKPTVAAGKPAHLKHIEDLTHLYESLADAKRRSAEALTNEAQSGARNTLAEEKAKLVILNETHVISTRQRLEAEARLEKTFAADNIAALEIQWGDAVKARQEATAAASVMVLSPKKQAETELRMNQLLTNETKKREELENAISNEKQRAGKTGLEIAKNDTAETHKRLSLEKELAALKANNAAAAASIVGTNAAGGFDSITDQIANQMAMQQQAHENRIDNITKESQALLDQADKIDNLAAREKAYQSIAAGDSQARAIAEKKNSQATTKIAIDGYKSQLSAASQYTGMAGQFFTALASTQDQSSRSGFESAKAFNIAAATMSTASAVMNALATVQPYPMALAAAALAAATGVIQIAKIAATTFGGASGSVSAPSGSVSASGGASGTGLDNLATPMTSIEDSRIQDLSIAATDRNTYVIGKLSKTMEELTGLFKEGGAGNGLAVNAPGRFTELSSANAEQTAYIKNVLTASGNYLGLNPLSTIKTGIASVLGSWHTTGAGLSVGFDGGNAEVQDYVELKKKKAFKNRYQTNYTDNEDASEYISALMKPFVNDIGNMAQTLGLVFDPTEYKASAVKISTAGKTAEQIGTELSGLMASTLSGMTLTIDGMDELIGNYDDAYTRIKQINDAWVTANEQLQLAGINPLAIGGRNAVNAENAQNSLYGGIEGFKTAMEDYREVMFTDVEKGALDAAAAQRKLNTAWLAINETIEGAGIAIPKTNAEFNALRATLDPNGALFASLTLLGPTFAEITKQADEVAASTRAFSNDLTERTMRLAGLNGAADMLALRVKQEEEMKQAILDGMDVKALAIVQDSEWAVAVKTATDTVVDSIVKIVDAAKTAASDMISAQTVIANSMKALKAGPLAMLSPEANYIQARDTFANLVGKTDLVSLQKLPDAVNGFLEASKAFSPDLFSYQTDFEKAMEAMRTASGATGSTLPEIDAQITLLNQIKKSIDDGAAATVTGLSLMLGPTSTLAGLIGTWSEATQAKLEEDKITTAANLVAVAGQTYERANTTYTAAIADLPNQYRTSVIDAATFNSKAAEAYSPINSAYSTATTAGVTGLTAPTLAAITSADTNARMMNKAGGIVAEITKWLTPVTSTDTTGGKTLVKPVVYYNPLYDLDPLGGGDGRIGASDLSLWSQIATGAVKWSDIGLPAFASGGDHLGGFRIVGEYGPELEATGASRIFNADQTRNIFQNGSADNRNMVAELRALREEVRELRNEQKAGHVAIAKNTGDSAKQLRRWDGDGLPPFRGETEILAA